MEGEWIEWTEHETATFISETMPHETGDNNNTTSNNVREHAKAHAVQGLAEENDTNGMVEFELQNKQDEIHAEVNTNKTDSQQEQDNQPAQMFKDNEHSELSESVKEIHLLEETLDVVVCGESTESVDEIKVLKDIPNKHEHNETADDVQERNVNENLSVNEHQETATYSEESNVQQENIDVKGHGETGEDMKESDTKGETNDVNGNNGTMDDLKEMNLQTEDMSIDRYNETLDTMQETNLKTKIKDSNEHSETPECMNEKSVQQIEINESETIDNAPGSNFQQENLETPDGIIQIDSQHEKVNDSGKGDMTDKMKENQLKQQKQSEHQCVKETKTQQDKSDGQTLKIQDHAEISKTVEENNTQQEKVLNTSVNDTYTHNIEQNQIENNESEDGVRGICELQDQVNKMRKNRTKKRKTRQKFKYLYSSSSDEDIPLSHYMQHTSRFERTVTENDFISEDEIYDPLQDAVNSTDSEYENLLSKKSREKLKREKQFKRMWDNTVKLIQKRKSKETSNDIHDVLLKSAEVADSHQKLIQKETEKLEAVLLANGLKREQVLPYGDCFFEASGKQLDMTASILRCHLCNTLDDNLEDYIWFVMNTHQPDNEEAFVTEYLTEIENLRQEGYWTSNVADFLPLALANFSRRNVVIYTNKDEQPIIRVSPLESYQQETGAANDIKLAYISIPGVFEHYDACSEISAIQEEYTATPIVGIRCEERIGTSVTSMQDSVPQESTSPLRKQPTPRKKAVFITPQKKVLTRKRKATPQNWKKNVRKRLKLSGEEYISADGKIRQARSLKQVNCSKCRYKCDTKITEDQRQQLFDSFWEITNYERQKDYVCARIEERNTKTFLDEAGTVKIKKRHVTRRFFLEIEGVRHQTCRTFFMKTLSIGKGYIDHAMKYKKEGHFVGTDLRGKHVPHNKLATDTVGYIKAHIESFPTVGGHYVRKDTNRLFLGSELTLTKMYELYLEKCKIDEMQPVKLCTYRKLFSENYNFSFHVPKKDQCNTCVKFDSDFEKGLVTDFQKEAYENHQRRKIRAREEKNMDKDKAKVDPRKHVACFDLQSVLYTPCSLVSLMYYMRKLCCYNLSIYSLGDQKGTCFVWTEVDGKRGASEIATCLRLHLLSLPEAVDEVVLYSDACGGQNRNRIVASSLLHSVNTIKHIKEINHKFLESGHTHMEVDSMHAGVEFAKKNTQIFVPSQWDTVLQMARRRNPYKVVAMKYTDILDYKLYQVTHTKPKKKTEAGEKPMWSKMKWMKYVQSEPDTIYFKYDYDGDFDKVKVTGQTGQPTFDDAVPMKYQKKIPISLAKKRDLLQLCKNGYIPSEFHDFYKRLPSSGNSVDSLPEPDALEQTSDESNIE